LPQLMSEISRPGAKSQTPRYGNSDDDWAK
jgi:hypothetical protein